VVVLFEDFVARFCEFSFLFLFWIGGRIHFVDSVLTEVGADGALLFGH